MDLNPVVLSIPLYFTLIGIELLVNRFQKRNLYRLNDSITNISCGVTEQLSGVFLTIFGVGIYQLVWENARLFDIPSNWLTIIILFILGDLAYYWSHRMSHQINLFWGGHVVHHQSEEYNLSVSLRQSSFQVIWTFSFHLPLALIGFNTVDHVMVMGFNLIYQFCIHTETIGKLGWLEYVFNTPSHHRVHHGRDPKYIDKNHAGVFIVWDRLFGTFQEEEERPTYGITTPVNSWNPVWANINHYATMWKTLGKIDLLPDKIRYIFNKPGWLPKHMGGYQPAPPVNKATYTKFNTTSTLSLNLYVMLQYAIAMGCTAIFLFGQSNFDYAEKVLIAIGVMYTIVNCGLLFEGKRWVKYTEYLRLIIVGIAGAYIGYLLDWNWVVVIGSGILVITSSVWLATLKTLEILKK